MRKAVRKRSLLLKPAGFGSLEGLSSTDSTLPASFLPVPTDGRVFGRRTRSRMLSFWLEWKTEKSVFDQASNCLTGGVMCPSVLDPES